MKVCKICEKVKFEFQFYDEYFCGIGGCVSEKTDICKKCAKDIEYKAVIRENKLLTNKQ